jgi:chemotaxis protein CheD
VRSKSAHEPSAHSRILVEEAREVDESSSNERSSLYLHPGQIFASSEPTAVKTILGSCVAVCLWDCVRRQAGMNHYLLPYGIGEGPAGARYGNVALERLIRKLLELGSRKQDLQAKLFGGACVIEAFKNKGTHLGRKNVKVARRLLAEEEIPVTSEDVGGGRGRKLIFHSDDGTVWVKRL